MVQGTVRTKSRISTGHTRGPKNTRLTAVDAFYLELDPCLLTVDPPNFSTALSSVPYFNKDLAIANRSRVSCINTNRSTVTTIWLPQESHAGMSLPSPVLRIEALAIRQESLRHILASPGYAPGKIAVNVTWMERGFNACQTHRSMYSSIFNRLRARSIARYWAEIVTFSTLCI